VPLAALSVAKRSHAPQYHNRMPVVLDDIQFDNWMRGTPDQAAQMMKPYAGEIETWEVPAEVGNVKNNRPELMERVGFLA
jgi:putative SOS response-associated peptidase YedK